MTDSSIKTPTIQEVHKHFPGNKSREALSGLITEHSDEERPVSRWREVICSVVCLGLAAVVLSEMNEFTDRGGESGALNGSFWPTMLSLALIVIAVGITSVRLFSKAKALSDQQTITLPGTLRLIGAIVLLAAYVASWGLIQFGVSTALVTAMLTYLFGGRNLTSWLFFPLGLGLAFHLFFIVLLKVPIQ